MDTATRPLRTLLAYTSGPQLAADYFAAKIPVGLGLLNAVLNRAGYPARAANLSRFGAARLRDTLLRERPGLLGISVFTFNRHPSRELARLAKSLDPGCFVVAGGPHVTHLDRAWLEAYPEFDAVVLGEGEQALLELAGRLAAGQAVAGTPGVTARDTEGRIVAGPPRVAIDELDRLPHGADYLGRSLGIDVRDQLRYFISSRGCPGACTFCNTPEFWGRRVRFRSAADVMAELRTIRERHGVPYVSIRDDTFTAHRGRTIELCERLIDSGLHLLWDCQSRVNLVDQERLDWMKRAGCQHIQYGVESGSEPLLRRLQKDITLEQIRAAIAASRRAGLVVSIYLVSGVPGETDEDIARTVELVRETLPHDGIVAPLSVYPGTRLLEESRARLGIDDSVWFRDRRDAIYLRRDAEAQRHHRTLLGELERTGRCAAYRPADLDAVQERLGFTFTSALLRSEWHGRRGERDLARAAAEEIVRREPRNPWGPLRLEELSREEGRWREAEALAREARALLGRQRGRSLAAGGLARRRMSA